MPVCRFADLGGPKTFRFPGLDPQNVQVSRFKRACRFRTQTWKPARLGGPNLVCTFSHGQGHVNGAYPQFARPSVRMGGHVQGHCDPGSSKSHKSPKPANLHVLGGPNLETSTFWGSKPGNLHVLGVQTWMAGPNLKPARFWGSKPGNVNVLGVQPGNLHILGPGNLHV